MILLREIGVPLDPSEENTAHGQREIGMAHNKAAKWIGTHKGIVALVVAAMLVTALLTAFVLSGASNDFLNLAKSKLGLDRRSGTSVSEAAEEKDTAISTEKPPDFAEPSSSGSVTEFDSSPVVPSDPTEPAEAESSTAPTAQISSEALTSVSSSTAATTTKPTTSTSATTKSSPATTSTAAPTTATSEPTTTTSINMGDFSGSFNSGKAEDVLALVNAAREAEGLSALSWSSALVTSATIRAPEIVVKWSHTRPDGNLWSTAFSSNPGSIGENIAKGYSSSQGVFDGWMASEGHRENILDSGFTKMGIACYYCNGMYYWVQHFSS